ncbi:hypothetical protein KR093_004653, partial [Drosophila rubida]
DSDSDEEDAAQMLQFLEAADHTLLHNDMFQSSCSKLAETKHVSALTAGVASSHEKPKSERYLDEQSASGADLQITEHMQAHIWKKLGNIIEKQIEYFEPKAISSQEKSIICPNNVRLLFGANCFIEFETLEEKLPTKKPKTKLRRLQEAPPTTHAELALIAVSGKSILEGHDMQNWSQRKRKKHVVFEYKSCDGEGRQLQLIEPTNEFTSLRRKNQWDESKILKKHKIRKYM